MWCNSPVRSVCFALPGRRAWRNPRRYRDRSLDIYPENGSRSRFHRSRRLRFRLRAAVRDRVASPLVPDRDRSSWTRLKRPPNRAAPSNLNRSHQHTHNNSTRWKIKTNFSFLKKKEETKWTFKIIFLCQRLSRRDWFGLKSKTIQSKQYIQYKRLIGNEKERGHHHHFVLFVFLATISRHASCFHAIRDGL